MCNVKRQHLTTRTNSDGSLRYYFFKRGLPIARLPDPSSPGFAAAYDAKLDEMETPNISHLSRARDGYRRHWATYLWDLARKRANRPCCTITPDDILAMIERQDDRCALSGLTFRYRKQLTGRDPLAPSLDRIDNSDGYTVANCRVVLLAVNVALNTWGDDTFLRICKAVARNAPPPTVMPDRSKP